MCTKTRKWIKKSKPAQNSSPNRYLETFSEQIFQLISIFYLFLQNESQRRLSSSSRLNDQERKTRIAFLQNRQAELETEIQLLKQSQEFDKLMTDEPLISDSLLTRYVICSQIFRYTWNTGFLFIKESFHIFI